MAKAKASAAAAGKEREADRRKTILRAAVETFAKKGYHGCRIADVAQEAGVAYGLVYHYFKNKEELLQSVFEVAWGGFVSRLREAVQSADSLEGQIRGVCSVAFDAYLVDPRGVRVVIVEVARSPMTGGVNRATVFAEVIEMAVEMFESARERGELRAGLDPRLCATMLFGAVEMALTALVLGFFGRPDETYLENAKQQLADSVLLGMLAPSRRPVSRPLELKSGGQGKRSRSMDSGST